MLKRRAQTEGRIGILKNVFLQETPRAKGFENRALQVYLSFKDFLISQTQDTISPTTGEIKSRRLIKSGQNDSLKNITELLPHGQNI